jgi:hypothetical protein
MGDGNIGDQPVRGRVAQRGIGAEGIIGQLQTGPARDQRFEPRRALFGPGQGVDLELPSRRSTRPLPEFGP